MPVSAFLIVAAMPVRRLCPATQGAPIPEPTIPASAADPLCESSEGCEVEG